MLNIKLSLLALVGFAALAVAPASAIPVSNLTQTAQNDVQDARLVCNSRGRCYGLCIALALMVDIALMAATRLPMATARVLAMGDMGTAAPATAGMGTVALALGSVSASDAVIKPRL